MPTNLIMGNNEVINTTKYIRLLLASITRDFEARLKFIRACRWQLGDTVPISLYYHELARVPDSVKGSFNADIDVVKMHHREEIPYTPQNIHPALANEMRLVNIDRLIPRLEYLIRRLKAPMREELVIKRSEQIENEIEGMGISWGAL